MDVKLNRVQDVKELPQILALTAGGEPLRWVTYEKWAEYAVKGKILWSTGEMQFELRGGYNAITGLRSVLKMDTIIALRNDTSPNRYRAPRPHLNNRTLFERDRYLCAYCVTQFSPRRLSRDHVKPRGKGGLDIWDNVVTSCYTCNQRKGNRTPEQAGMELAFVPYTPTYHECLILRNRRILADQMDYLMKGVSKNSRLLENGPVDVFH